MSKTERTLFTRGLMIIIAMVIMAVSMPITALASDGFQVGATVYVNVNDYLNLREVPQGTIIGQIARGETVTILAKKDRDGYYKVRVNRTNETGFCFGEYLTQEKISKNRTSTKPATNDQLKVGDIYSIHTAVTLRLKKEPSVSANYYRFFSDGEELKILDTKVQEGYVKVLALKDGQEGYAYFKYMTKIRDAETPTQSQKTEPATVVNTWYIGQRATANVEYKLILRELPSAEARALDYLDPGTEVKIVSNELEGYYIKVELVGSGREGYCDTRYLEPVMGEGQIVPQTFEVVRGMIMYVNNEGRLNFREDPSFSDNVICQLHVGTQVRIVNPEITEGFVQVSTTSDGEIGYVQLKYLTINKP